MATTDRPQRERIATDLDTNLLVEAGAGSGKTTELVTRMLALVRRGTPVGRVAAVTFTRKAAKELREKFQQKLEQALAAARAQGGDAHEADRLDQALRTHDQPFIGTIHAFCARLLREHPLEAGLDPAFEEMDETRAPLHARAFWEHWVASDAAAPHVTALAALGLKPRELFDAFLQVVEQPDVRFPTEPVPAPDIAPVRAALRDFVARASALLPADEPAPEWDDLQQTVQRLRLLDRITDWHDPVAFCDALAGISATGCKVVQQRWGSSREEKDAAKALGLEAAALLDGSIAPLLARWRAHRYAPVMAFLQHAASAYHAERFAAAQLTFEDLLLGAARLLRESEVARDRLGERYRHLLVDEFQDTDPLQAEVCLLLASPPSEGTDWRTVRPRAGALFVVGDPKQGIYRFRRADIETYELAKRRFAQFGDVLRLTANWRSVHPIGGLVRRHFEGPFPAEATAEQAAFAPLETQHAPERPYHGVFGVDVTPDANNHGAIVARDAQQLAAWIAGRVASGERQPGDFLLLTHRKDHLEPYARAIAAHDLPVAVSGAPPMQEQELRELLVLLRALADPGNPVPVVAALEGMFFGCSPADCWAAHQGGVGFAIAGPVAGDGVVARALTQLHRWLELARREPADRLIAALLDDTGLLAWAAGQPLGDNRGGVLLSVVDAVRGLPTDPAPDLRQAITTIEHLLAVEASDALLMPGRSDVVRVMNLHKAKGLEAEVVLLAAPVQRKEFEPRRAVQRGADGVAVGGLQVRDDAGAPVAEPRDWAALAEREGRFEAAERVRLLYVAVTRAKQELVVSRLAFSNSKGPVEDRSLWSPLGPALSDVARPIQPAMRALPAARVSALAPIEVDARVAAASERRDAAMRAGFARRTVTEEAKRQLEPALPDADLGRRVGRGKSWGNAVHRVLEARGRGRTGASLARFARAVAADEGVADREEALLAVVARLEAEGRWTAGGDALVEAPLMTVDASGEVPLLREGVIDAARLVDGRWLVDDWKTDVGRDGSGGERLEAYRRQVARYAAMLQQLTGAAAEGRVVGVGGA